MFSAYRHPIIFMALLLSLLACNFITRALPATPQVPTPADSPTPFLPAPTLPIQPVPLTPTAILPPTPTIPPPTPTPTVAYQPTFEPGPCAFPIPAGYDPDCGYLVVPENRSKPDSPLIRLHVAIFRSRSAEPTLDPVVHLAGGPGSSSLDVAGYMLQQGMDAILDRRDFILFDQRGTGFSQPRLDCPEREALTPLLLDGSLLPEEASQAIVEAFRYCHDRLISEGIDLTAYNSAASAADVNDLRLALGYARLNLYGVSYGTRLALTVLRDHPEAVRSVVLDSAYPPQVNLYTSLAPNAERAFNVLFASCEADPACNTAYPDLETIFYALVDQLNADPVQVSLTVDGVERRVQVDGNRLIDVLFVGLYNRVVIASMPRMIFEVRQGDYSLLRERLALYFDTSSALGMQVSVQCAEEIPFNQPGEAFTAAQGVQPQIAAFFPSDVQSLFAACREWNAGPYDGRENQPVASDLPVLVMAGEYDPITPPDWGRMAAGTLSQAYFYEFPGNGHWVTRSSSCAVAMALAFWDDPSQAPDATCLQTEGGLDFR